MQQVNTKAQLDVAPFVYETEEKGFENEAVKVYRWTRDEYYKMAELGFFDGKRVELIEGEIIEMSPMKSLHATAVSRISQGILNRVFHIGYAELRDNRAVNHFDERMHDRLRMHDDRNFISRKTEQPARFDNFQTFVHQSRRVNRNFVAHFPIRMI